MKGSQKEVLGKVVGPTRKRKADGNLRRRLEVFDRRVCQVVGLLHLTEWY